MRLRLRSSLGSEILILRYQTCDLRSLQLKISFSTKRPENEEGEEISIVYFRSSYLSFSTMRPPAACFFLLHICLVYVLYSFVCMPAYMLCFFLLHICVYIHSYYAVCILPMPVSKNQTPRLMRRSKHASSYLIPVPAYSFIFMLLPIASYCIHASS